MVHPADLLRSSSNAEAFTAPMVNINDQHDCGLNTIPWTREKLAKFNRNSIFLTFLSVLIVLHSCSTSYFVGTTRVWRLNYHIFEVTAEWIVYLNPIFGGIFSLIVSHYGNIIHRPCYIGVLAMLNGVVGWLLILPELYHPQYAYLNTTAVEQQTICRPYPEITRLDTGEYDDGKKYIAMIILGTYQLIHGLSFVSIVTHGVPHIDDGSSKLMTPIYICFVVAVGQIGRFIGLNLTLIPITFNRHIFFSCAWLLLMTSIFLFGFFISLFAKLPEKMLLRHGVNTLLNGSRLSRYSRNQAESTQQPQPEETKNETFPKSVSSLFTSNHLLLNSAAALFMHTAVINFNALREEFYRARFINFADDFNYRFSFYNISALLFMLMMVLLMSQIISRWSPGAKFYIVWLLVSYIAILGFFSSYAFLKCEDQAFLMKYNQVLGACNGNCNCHLDVFDPVCLDGKTYYSACYAGCLRKNGEDYSGCQCAITPSTHAISGSCNQKTCNIVAMFSEANSIIIYGLLSSSYIIHIIISLRTVQYQQHRAISIGFLLLGIYLLPFFPFKIIYEVIKSTHCAIKYNSECVIFTDHFALVISSVTIAFMFISVILTFCMLRGVDQLEIYKRRGSRFLGIASMRVPATNGNNDPRRQDVIEEIEEEIEELLPVRLTPEADILFSQIGTKSDTELDGNYLNEIKHHKMSPRRNLHQLISLATVVSPDGSILEQNAVHKVATPRFETQHNLSSDDDVFESHESMDFDSRHGNNSNLNVQENNKDQKRFLSKLQHNDALELESEGFGDTDIDAELEQIEREYQDSPKCLRRQNSAFNETDF